MNRKLILSLILAFVFFQKNDLSAQCAPDTEAPVAVCDIAQTAVLGPDSTVTISGIELDDGSHDNCSAAADLEFALEEMPLSTDPPTTTSLTFDETQLGLHDLVMWVGDEAGNWNQCMTTVEVVECTMAPSLVCSNIVPVNVPAGGTVQFLPEDILVGGPYCLPAGSTFQLQLNPPSTPEPVLEFDETHIGQHLVSVTLYDAAGNPGNSCWGNVEVLSSDCTNDIYEPIAYCKNGLEVELGSSGQIIVEATDLDVASFDNCTPASLLEFRLEFSPPSANAPATTNLDFDTPGTYSVAMWVGDEAGNWAFCETTVEIVECTPTTNLACNNLVYVSLDTDLTADFQIDFILEGSYACLPTGAYIEMQLDPPSASVPVIPLDVDDLGSHTVMVTLYDQSGAEISSCWGGLEVEIHPIVTGTVFLDTLTNCNLDSEPGLEGFPVQGIGQVTGTVYETTTGAGGAYNFFVEMADTLVEVSLPLGFNYGQSCPTTYLVHFPLTTTSVGVQDIPVQLNSTCPLLSVDISSPFLRRCFDNVYHVNYCNLSASAIDDISVEVTLDGYMDVTSTSIPGTQLDSTTWSFDIGTLQPGECGGFEIDFYLDCDAPFGLTHCVEAHILPDTICPQTVSFSGANIEVSGYCENDLIHLNITNTGTAAMAVPLDYIVVEDVIMLEGGTFDLGPGQAMPLDPIVATGATYRLEAEQEINHPYGGVAAIAIEGCGGSGTPGFVNFFPMNPPNPFIATDCQPNVGSYDPNDKLAFPTGYSEEHFIEKNTDIEYLIRFQNTGTDTAFNVVLLDTLSQFLAPASIRPGAASHEYQFEMLEGNIARFTFPDIMLPDSNINVALSHGFVKFRASQMPDLTNGTVIENTAAIYFDFNEAVITGTVFHTIGEHFIEVVSSANERPDGLGELSVFPNPSFGNVTFELPADAPGGAVFQLLDNLGRTVKMGEFAAGKYRFERGALTAGIYFYSVEIQGVGKYAGKVVLR